MDQQQIDEGKLKVAQAVVEGTLKIGSRKLVLIHLGGDEDVLALETGGAQPLLKPLPHRRFIAIALGGVDMAISEPQSGLDSPRADGILERHGARGVRRPGR